MSSAIVNHYQVRIRKNGGYPQKKSERKEALEYASESKERLKEEVVQEVLKALESTKVEKPISESENGDDEHSE